MTYTVNKVDDQDLMFHIATTHNGKEITFNVVCAKDESEIEGLVAFHLDTLDSPPAIQPQQKEVFVDTSALIQEQQTLITALTARITALEQA